MSDRIGQIRERLKRYAGDYAGYLNQSGKQFAKDCRYLLRRIDELERENERLEHQLEREIETAIEYRRADEW